MSPSSICSIAFFPSQPGWSELGAEGDPKPPSLSLAAEGEDTHVRGGAVSWITQLLERVPSRQKEQGPRR